MAERTMEQEVLIILASAFGAIVKDLVKDGKLVLPKVQNGELWLGFLSGVIIGIFAGLLVDGRPITAAMGGYFGSSVVERLMVIPIKEEQGGKRK